MRLAVAVLGAGNMHLAEFESWKQETGTLYFSTHLQREGYKLHMDFGETWKSGIWLR